MPRRKKTKGTTAAIIREYLRQLGSRGGKVAAERMTKEQRVLRAKKAATSRPAEERRESARKAARARWGGLQ
jgi:hypothetical protein